MADIPERIALALEADDSMELERVIDEAAEKDIAVLRAVVTDSAAPTTHRTRAMFALGRWGDERSAQVIVRTLPELDERGMIAAVDALGRLGTPEALNAVVAQAGHESPHVRKFVVEALARSSDPAAQAKLDDMASSDEVEFVRSLARRRIAEAE